jgi:hypothetical protein
MVRGVDKYGGKAAASVSDMAYNRFRFIITNGIDA